MNEKEEKGRKFGKYVIEKKLGQGGMGAVYLAFDPALNRNVALKIMLLKGEAAIERFTREARSMARLKHPNIINIYEVGTAGNYRYIAMDYVDGDALSRLIRDKRVNMTLKDIVRIIRKIALALDYAHSEGVIHRDIKPANILVDRNTGEPYLTDFGLAKELSGTEHSLTLSGTVVGTPDYMSPEQAMGHKNQIDHLSDIFSLGSTFYHCLTGCVPFTGKELYQVMNNVVNKDPVPPRKFVNQLDRDIETICLKCMDKDRRLRYKTSRELADDMERYLNGDAILARPFGFFARLLRKAARNKAASAVMAGAVILVVIVTVIFAVTAERKKRETDELVKKANAEAEKSRIALEFRNRAKAVLDRITAADAPADRIKAAQDALAIDPSFGDAYQVIGYAFKETREWDKAYEAFSEAVRLTPTLAYSYFERGNILADIRGDEEAAAADYGKVIENDPNSHIGWFAKGRVETVRGNIDVALSCFDRAIGLKENFPAAYNARGIIYMLKQMPDRAIEEFDTALKYDPRNADAYMQKGTICLHRGETDKAINFFTKSIECYPEQIGSWQNRAAAYSLQSDYDRALADYRRAIEINPGDAFSFFGRGQVFFKQGDYTRALEDFNAAIKLKPNQFNYYLQRGNTCVKLGMAVDALSDYNAAIKINPENHAGYIVRGFHYLRQNDTDKAVSDFSEAIRRKPDGDEGYYARGTVYAQRSDFNRAVPDLAKAVELNPKYAEAYCKLGDVYSDTGQFDMAVQAYTSAMKLKPGDFSIYIGRGIAYGRTGGLDKSISDLTKALELNPVSSAAYYNRGFAYYQKGDTVNAVADWQEFLSLTPDAPEAPDILRAVQELKK